MPSPIAHISFGVAPIILGNKSHVKFSEIKSFIIACIFLSILPDFDFIPGFFVSDINRYHHGVSHSLSASIIASTLVWLLFLKKNIKIKPIKLWFFFWCAYVSHIILDYLSVDHSFPYGIPLFWPFIENYYVSPIPIFFPIEKSGSDFSSFFESLLNLNNTVAISLELGLSILLWILLIKYRVLKR